MESHKGFHAMCPYIQRKLVKKSEFQRIEVVEHPWLGNALLLDDVIQCTDR